MTLLAEKRAAVRRSTVALKTLMAVSGIIMLGYVLVHMYGNLKFFYGKAEFDGYLDSLDEMLVPYLPHGVFMWLVRILLVAALITHVACAAQLWRRNKVAAGYQGGKRYYSKQNRRGIQRSYASFTMRWGGVILLLYVIGHVAQMMPNWLAPGGASDSKYERMVNGFSLWWVVLLYTIGLLALGFHIWHGFWSAFTTLGANRSGTRRGSNLTWLAAVIALVITVGFLVVPYAIIFFGVGV